MNKQNEKPLCICVCVHSRTYDLLLINPPPPKLLIICWIKMKFNDFEINFSLLRPQSNHSVLAYIRMCASTCVCVWVSVCLCLCASVNIYRIQFFIFDELLNWYFLHTYGFEPFPSLATITHEYCRMNRNVCRTHFLTIEKIAMIVPPNQFYFFCTLLAESP